MTSSDRAAVRDQIHYYDARSEADDAWYKADGTWDMGTDANRAWIDGVKQARDELEELLPIGRALDIACGSGVWTRQLAQGARHVVALDGSPRMLDRAKQRLSTYDNVSYVCSDVFDYEADERFDFALTTFWVSHIPAAMQPIFWDRIVEWLKPSATLFLVDHQGNEETQQSNGPSDVHTRLWEGQSYRVIKVPVHASDVNEALKQRGFSSRIRDSGDLVVGPAFGSDVG
jgi:demethylmenaquinone methyltransferase/2-methoxy-6-polyprenyl-1,4-benzoquinol methylase